MVTLGLFAHPASASITSVSILPIEPTPSDVISVVTSGNASAGPVSLGNVDLDIVGTNISLDLYLNTGPYTIVTPWSFSEDIGTLPVGFYNITVKAYELSQPAGTYSTSFEVVPEPVSLALFSFIGSYVVMRRRSH